MSNEVSANKKMIINQDEIKREKMKVAFEYCVEKISASMNALKEKHIYDEVEPEEELVKILESNIEEFKSLLNRVVDFEKDILEKFQENKNKI